LATSFLRAAEHLRAVGAPDDDATAAVVAGAAFALREREIAAQIRALTVPTSEREDQRR